MPIYRVTDFALSDECDCGDINRGVTSESGWLWVGPKLNTGKDPEGFAIGTDLTAVVTKEVVIWYPEEVEEISDEH